MILECGASGLTVGVHITQDAKKVCGEGRQCGRERIPVIGIQITTLTNCNSWLISHCDCFKIQIYLLNLWLWRQSEGRTSVRLTVHQTCLHLEKSSRWTKARRRRLPENCAGQYKQAGRSAAGWDLFLLVKGDMLAAIFHHHLVLNPSKSLSLWQHTRAAR